MRHPRCPGEVSAGSRSALPGDRAEVELRPAAAAGQRRCAGALGVAETLEFAKSVLTAPTIEGSVLKGKNG